MRAELKKMIENGNGDPWELNLAFEMLDRRLNDVCEFCGGCGHFVGQCSTRRYLDKLFGRMRFTQCWGFYKSLVLKSRINAKSLKKKARYDQDAGIRLAKRVKPG